MVITKITTSILLRVAEFLFAVAVLGLSAGVLASYNTNIPRVTFNLVVAIFDIIWLAYIALITPKTLAGQTPSAVVFACQIILWIFYLAGWTVIVDEFPKDCNKSFYMRDSKDTCHAYQAILPFSILNYIVLSTELGLFYSYSLVPEIRNFGGKHLLQNTTYYWGTLFNAETTTATQCCAGIGTGDVVGKDGGVATPHLDEEAVAGNPVNEVKM